MHSISRTLRIEAAPDVVFRFFTDTARWARWWGEGSAIDARPGGKVVIRYPGGVEVAGEVIEVTPPQRLVFTYGYVSGKPMPARASRVTIVLSAEGSGTRLRLTHEYDDPAVLNQHVQGWRFQLSLFANAVAAEVFNGEAVTALVDAWFAAWAESDGATRRAAFAAIAEDEVVFRDPYSSLEGIDELNAHAGAAQRFMPGIRLTRRGSVRQCQGLALADWVAAGSDGVVRMAGVNVYLLAPRGKIAAVTGVPASVPAANP
ncbi:MAG: SRPBCC domain-containing protein [Bryobacteraceae bacterium]